MKVNIKGLINHLDNLRERLNALFEILEEREGCDIAVESVERSFQNDDTFNLSVAIDLLEQADKLDKVLEIIVEKNVNLKWLAKCSNSTQYNFYDVSSDERLCPEEFKLLKEVLI